MDQSFAPHVILPALRPRPSIRPWPERPAWALGLPRPRAAASAEASAGGTPTQGLVPWVQHRGREPTADHEGSKLPGPRARRKKIEIKRMRTHRSGDE